MLELLKNLKQPVGASANSTEAGSDQITDEDNVSGEEGECCGCGCGCVIGGEGNDGGGAGEEYDGADGAGAGE